MAYGVAYTHPFGARNRRLPLGPAISSHSRGEREDVLSEALQEETPPSHDLDVSSPEAGRCLRVWTAQCSRARA